MPGAARVLLESEPRPTRSAARPVRELVTSGDQASPEIPVAALLQVFRRDPEIEAVALVAARRPIGLVTRRALLLKLGRNFGYELFARRPALRIADPDPLLIEGDTSIENAVEQAFSRPPASAYDDVVVVDGGGAFAGLVSARRLAVEQGLALSRSVLEHESTLARNRELEKLESLRAQFLAHATHELRSPVNAIVGLAELLVMAGRRGDLPAIQERLAMLDRTARGLRGTVNDILDLSKIEAGKLEIRPEPFATEPLLQELAAMGRLLAASRPAPHPGALEVVVDAAAAPERLFTDRRRLHQVLLNLLSNAVKFTDAGRIALGGATEGPARVRLWVEDTGCGIAEEDVPRLFKPFGQLEDARTKSHAGTGLGLVISQSLARLLGGRIEVESRRGEGSRFTLHLPNHPVPEAIP